MCDLKYTFVGVTSFSISPDRYLSPVRPGQRVLPPDSPATPNSQAASQPPTQPAPQAAGQTPRPPKSNSLSLFYKKCEILFRP